MLHKAQFAITWAKSCCLSPNYALKLLHAFRGHLCNLSGLPLRTDEEIFQSDDDNFPEREFWQGVLYATVNNPQDRHADRLDEQRLYSVKTIITSIYRQDVI
jgi:hypothetical protein